MCMEDKKIGRNLRTTLTRVSMTLGVGVQVAKAAPDRVFLAFYSNGSNAVRVSSIQQTAGGTAGMTIANTRPFLEFDIEQYGNMVTEAWNGEAAGAGNDLFVVESFLYAKNANQLE